MLMNLHQVRVFKAVVEEGSFSRAAAALFMSQPAVSLQVKALERSMGLPLLDKSGHGLQLTQAGREVLMYGDRVLGLVDELGLVLEELRGAKRGEVKVAAS